MRTDSSQGDCHLSLAAATGLQRPSYDALGAMDLSSSFKPACRRCHQREHVITADGPTICRICVLAWGSLAGQVYAGTLTHEISRDELSHREHRVRQLGCWYCVASVGPRPADGPLPL